MDFGPNSLKFNCPECDYNTSQKCKWQRHLETMKHKMITNDDKMMTKRAIIVIVVNLINIDKDYIPIKKNVQKL